LAGLPPAIIGLVAKVVVLRPVAADGTWWLLAVATLNIALGIAVYVRWLAALIERETPGETVSSAREPHASASLGDGSAAEGENEGEAAAQGSAANGPLAPTAQGGATAVAGPS